MISDAGRRRLAEATDARRIELGLTWKKVAKLAGTTYETVRAARLGPGVPSAMTLRGLERALSLKPGNLDDVIAGTAPPTPVNASSPASAPVPRSAVETGDLTPEQAMHILNTVRALGDEAFWVALTEMADRVRTRRSGGLAM